MASNAPDIYFFNPTCEMAIANGTVSWQASRQLQQFERDLDMLPAFIAQFNDVVLVHQLPSKAFIEKLEHTGINVSKLLTWNDALNNREFMEEAKGWLKPWGWSQVVYHKFRDQLSSFSSEFRQSPVGTWKPKMKDLYSRKIARQVLSNVIALNIGDLISEEQLPVICTSEEGVERQHKRNGKSVLKSPWSSSGRGLKIVEASSIPTTALNWSRGVLFNQKYLMCEPLLNKVFDFSFQFEITAYKAIFLGITWFYTDEKGGYRGHYLKIPIDEISAAYLQLFEAKKHDLIKALVSEMEKQFLGNYIGIAGVDAMLICSYNNEPVIHPCVEINLRNNMGIIAMHLAHLTEKGYSRFEINTVKAFKEETITSLALSEINENSRFCAYLK